MSKEDVAINIIRHQLSDPDEAAIKAKTSELVSYIREEIDRNRITSSDPQANKGPNKGSTNSTIAQTLMDRLPGLLEVSATGIWSKTLRNFVYSSFEKSHSRKPGFAIHSILFSMLGFQRPKFRSRAEYFKEKARRVQMYKVWCEEMDVVFDPRKVNSSTVFRDVYTFLRNVFNNKYDDESEYQQIVPELEATIGQSLSKAISYVELENVLDAAYESLECKDLDALVAKVPTIFERAHGISMSSADPNYLALKDSTVKINDKAKALGELLSLLPLDSVSEDDLTVLHSVSTIVYRELCKAENNDTICMPENELEKLKTAAISKVAKALDQFQHIRHADRQARYMNGTDKANGNGKHGHQMIQVTARDQHSVAIRTALIRLGFDPKAAHAMAKLLKETNPGRLMLVARAVWLEEEQKWILEVNVATSMVQNKAGWTSEAFRTCDSSREPRIIAVITTYHRKALNILEDAVQLDLKASGRFLDDNKCGASFASEKTRPPHLPAPKKNSRKKKAATASSIIPVGRKQVDDFVEEVKDLDLSDGASDFLGKLSKNFDRLLQLEKSANDAANSTATASLLREIANLGSSGASTTNAAVPEQQSQVVGTTNAVVPSQSQVVGATNAAVPAQQSQVVGTTIATADEDKDEKPSAYGTLFNQMKNAHKKLREENRIITREERAEFDNQRNTITALKADKETLQKNWTQLDRQLTTTLSLQGIAENERDDAREQIRELEEQLRQCQSAETRTQQNHLRGSNANTKLVTELQNQNTRLQSQLQSATDLQKQNSRLQSQLRFMMNERHNVLPPNWERSFSRTGRPFYRHSEWEAGISQWHFPTSGEVANPAAAKERAVWQIEQERKRQRD